LAAPVAQASIAAELAAARRLTGQPIAVNLLLPFIRPGDVEAAAAADVIVTFWGRATPTRRHHLAHWCKSFHLTQLAAVSW
jgi:hypothetical protein